MKISDLAGSLGLSRQIVHWQKAQWIPTDSLETAFMWNVILIL